MGTALNSNLTGIAGDKYNKEIEKSPLHYVEHLLNTVDIMSMTILRKYPQNISCTITCTYGVKETS